MIQRDDAVIIKSQNWSETSRIIHAFSRHSGRIKLVAKGARRPKSRFGAAFEPGTLTQVVYYSGRSSDLHTTSEAAVLWRPRHSDLDRIALRSAALELAYKATSPESPNVALFANLLRFLQSLDDSRDGLCHTQLIAFLLLAMNNLGYSPVLDRCCCCKRQVTGIPCGFSVLSGGIICDACHKKTGETIPLSPAQHHALGLWQSHQALPDLPPQESRRLINVLSAFLNHHLPGRSKLLCAKYIA